jgi:hypothetical protein
MLMASSFISWRKEYERLCGYMLKPPQLLNWMTSVDV